MALQDRSQLGSSTTEPLKIYKEGDIEWQISEIKLHNSLLVGEKRYLKIKSHFEKG